MRSSANPPVASYIFPAGGQRGTTVPVRVGGLFLHDRCGFDPAGPGVMASPELTRTDRIWFEGPLLPIPESQQQEDYPADMRGEITLAKDARPGAVRGRVFTSQGAAGGLVFVVGNLPEVIEHEIDGEPIPEPITLPVTANGRIFPREDVDLWEFDARAGQTVTAFVHAQSINSPLVPRLDILDANGKLVAEQMTYPCVGTDASVKFTPKVAGKYRVRITDARTLGGPAFVYRLTVTTEHVPEFHHPLKVPPDGLKDVTETKDAVAAPVALDGRIEKAGGANEWAVELTKGRNYSLDLQARRFESPLQGVVSVHDAAGKELARSESNGANDPAAIPFTPPADGTFTVRITERFRTRGGPNFVYRLRITDGSPPGEPDFRLTVVNDALTVSRGGSIKVNVDRHGPRYPVIVTATDLPRGVAAKPAVIRPELGAAELTITAAADAEIAARPIRIDGMAITGLFTRRHTTAVVAGTRLVPDSPHLTLAVALPTPFKITDGYVMTSAPRGETYRRKYTVDRGGFDGPISISLADRQARHLQGVTGPTITLAPGQTEFEYPALLPPWMEMGRTCRVCVMATATVKDPVDGREHAVSFSSVEPNQQMIVVVGPGRLDLSCDRTSVRAEPGGEVRIAVKVSRAKGLVGPTTVAAVLPEHWKGVSAAPLVIPADADGGELVLKFDRDCGPFNAPLVLSATVETKDTPVVAEAKVEVVR